MLYFSFPIHTLAYIICLVPYIIFELYIRYYKENLKKEYRSKKEAINSSEDAEIFTIEHFNKLQSLDIARMVIFVLLVMVLLSVADVSTFSFLAVTIGAIIITIRDYLTSLIAYPYILANFDIGDDIKINSVLGSIVRIQPLIVSLAGKDAYGESTGILHQIPNSKFIIDIVERQEIKNHNYRCVNLQILYSNELFKNVFSVWLTDIKKYLDEVLTKRTLKDVGNYKTYSGVRYKLYYNYNEKGEIVVSVSFISRTKNSALKREEIIEYIESTKK